MAGIILGGLALIGVGIGAVFKGLHELNKKAKEKQEEEEKTSPGTLELHRCDRGRK